MTTTTTYYMVAPRYISRHRTVQAAIARAEACDRAAASYGRGAGADCYVVRARGEALEYRGMACGRRLVGRAFACAGGVLARVRAALAAGTVRE